MARPEKQVAVFVRAPQFGAVKTRLAAGIGRLAAWQFYRRITALILRRLARDPHWRVTLWVTPDWAARRGRFWPAHLPRMPQGRGDLGQRMARALRAAPHQPVLLVGSDLPDMDRAAIGRAFATLARQHLIFGPAQDGGYWLVGRRGRALPPHLFRAVRWSSARALADTRANVPRGWRVGWADTLGDVDIADDYARLRQMAGR